MRSVTVPGVLLILLMTSSCGREEGRPPTSPRDQVVTPGDDSGGIGILRGNICPTADPLDVVVGTLAPSGTIQLVGHDLDGDPLQYSITQAPAHGTAVVDASGLVTFSPTIGYCGPDTFYYRVSDGLCSSDIAQVLVKLNCCPEDDEPVHSIEKDTPFKFVAFATDANDDKLVYTTSDLPSHGLLVFDPVTLEGSYTPDAGYCGTDYFVIQAYDGHCHHNIFFHIIVCPVHDEDGDDVPDDEDDCPGSDVRETVWVDDCDSGVPNVIGGDPVNGSGCSLADLVHQAVTEARDGARNHGEFVSTFRALLKQLTRDGVLPREASAPIFTCAVHAELQP